MLKGFLIAVFLVVSPLVATYGMAKDVPALELYVSKNCGYCKKVIRFLEANQIEVVIKDVGITENKEFLLKNGKKRMVPCLFIEGKPLYESDDIIAYLGEHRKLN